jgi:hypothetical protein
MEEPAVELPLLDGPAGLFGAPQKLKGYIIGRDPVLDE